MPGLWSGGEDSYREGLKHAREARRAELSEQLKKAASQDEQETLARKLAELDAEFDAKERAARSSFY